MGKAGTRGICHRDVDKSLGKTLPFYFIYFIFVHFAWTMDKYIPPPTPMHLIITAQSTFQVFCFCFFSPFILLVHQPFPLLIHRCCFKNIWLDWGLVAPMVAGGSLSPLILFCWMYGESLGLQKQGGWRQQQQGSHHWNRSQCHCWKLQWKALSECLKRKSRNQQR